MLSKKASHLAGGKFTTSHSTVIPALVSPARAVEKLPFVSKIALSYITSVQSGSPSMKFFQESPNCILVKVRGRAAIQEVRIYLSESSLENIELVQNLMITKLTSK